MKTLKNIFYCFMLLGFLSYLYYDRIEQQKKDEIRRLQEKEAQENYLNSPKGQDETAKEKSLTGVIVTSATGKKFYRGMPCKTDCSEHETGYDWALEKGITNEDACIKKNNESFTQGCLAGIQENLESLKEYFLSEYCPCLNIEDIYAGTDRDSWTGKF